MSTKQRGTKRSADTHTGGPKAKFAKGGPAKSGGAGKFAGKPSGKFGGKPYGGKPAGKFAGKPSGHAYSKPKESEAPAQKRKRPVTMGGGEEDDDMSVDGDEFGDEEDDEMAVDGAEGAEGGEAPEKRGKMTKAERAALHAAQPHRTTKLPSHALLTELLPLWEEARRETMPKDERKKAIDELYNTVKGRILEISRGHKGGRILQTIVKWGGKEERLGVAMELEPQWKAMMESKYSKFLMSKLIRYCPSIRPLLIPHLTKNLSGLLFHADAVKPLSDFYDLYASAKERRLLVRGFYPREVALFDGAKEKGDVEGLEGALAATSETGRARVLDDVEKKVLDVFNATQKSALTQSIFHRFVYEYLVCIYRFLDAETAGKKMHEFLDAALESLPEIVHTKDGSAVVRELLVRGNAKDRKNILQHLKKHVEAIAKDADAQLVLFTAFDVVDDTKLMGKAFVSDLVQLAPTLVGDKNGRRAVLYLLTPRASRHFLPSTLQQLEANATQAREIGTSKKDPAVRRKELVGYASPGLLQFVADKADELVRDPGSGLAVTEIMLSATGDKSAAIDALVAPLAVPFSASADKEDDDEAEAEVETTHPLSLAHTTRTYKTLLSGGHFNSATKSIDVSDATLSPAFSAAVWKAITSDEAGGNANAIKAAVGAPFVVVEMLAALKNANGPEFKQAKNVLGGEDAIEAVKASEMKGSNVLADRLAQL